MKRLVSMIICLTLIATLSTTAFARFDIPNGSSLPLNATENVNLRMGPGTNYDSYGILNQGERFHADDDTYDPWYGGRVGVNTKLYQYYGYSIAGYVHSDYLGQ